MTQHNALLEQPTRGTPQHEQADPDQVENSAGGFSFSADCWQRLNRFLVLGVEGGSYYAGEQKLARENAQVVRECLADNGILLVNTIANISNEGRAPSNDPALFALAIAAKEGDLNVRKYALDQLEDVARTGTHLFHFIDFVKALGGMGRATKRAIQNWYLRDPGQVAYQAVKYRQRDGWSHRDVLRLAKPAGKDASKAHNELFDYITSGKRPKAEKLGIIRGFDKAQNAETPRESANLIREYGLTREMIQTDHLKSVEVWDALLENMPIGALVRNLGVMTANETLTATGNRVEQVLSKLGDDVAISKSRIHPIQLLSAQMVYQAGHGARGSLAWSPIPAVIDALDRAFYMAFENVEPTNKRICLALDISGSMDWDQINGVPGLTPRVASAALALVTAATENRYEVVAFSRGGWGTSGSRWGSAGIESVPLSGRQRLSDAMATIDKLPMGGTDCSLPMLWAQSQNKQFDTFVIYTDSETWAGTPHPHEAVQQYRRSSGIQDAKLIVNGMVSNGFSIADPKDPNMLDVVGFDTATPKMMSDFITGKI